MNTYGGERQPETAEQENELPAFQKIFSAELITCFGADYITLSPDHKEMLSFIFEQNGLPVAAYPGAGAIAEALWACKKNMGATGSYEGYQKKIKEMVVALEKGRFIIKAGHNKLYKINSSYAIAGNLFT